MSSTSAESLSSIKSKPPSEKWLFSEDQLQNTPSRRDNIPAAKELNYRQQAANLIQDMGQRLPVNQLTINTAIVYMHRFYMFHSFPSFSRFIIAPTALFLAAKVEEQPRKLEHVIKVCHLCLHPDKPSLNVHSDAYLEQAQQLVEHEIIMLQTLGFDISIDHPHTHVVKCTQLVKASRDLSQMAYFMATNSLHLTTFCLKYKPTVVSAMCIHLSCKWSNYEIPLSSEGKAYWSYMDHTITEAMLEKIIAEFLQILNLCPTRLRKLKSYRPSSREGPGGATPQHKDSSHQKPSTSKVSSGGHPTNRPTEVRRAKETTIASEQQKKPSSLTIAEYKHKREKEQQQQNTSKQLPSSSMDATVKSSIEGAKAFQHQSRVSNTQKQLGTFPGVHGASHPVIKAEGQLVKQQGKVMPKHPNHKQPTKSDGLKPLPIPGLQRPRQNNSQQPRHHDKDLSKMQSHTKQHQNSKLLAKPKEQSTLKVGESQSLQMNKPPPPKSNDSGDKILAGVEQKIMEHMNAEKAKEVPKPDSLPFGSSSDSPASFQQTPGHSKEQKSRHSLHSMQKEISSNPISPQPLPKSYKGLHELYKKNPDALRHQLKQKAQTAPLSDSEKQIWHKLVKKEEDRQKRKRKLEKHRLNRTHPVEIDAEGSNAAPSSGSLTVRIKLQQPTKALKGQVQSSASVGSGHNNPGSSSTSGSDASMLPGVPATKSGKKRSHAHAMTGLTAPAPKHLKRSEDHHHHGHSSGHDSSKHRHKHSRSVSHHHHSKSSQPGHKIDEATFQQALNDAVSMVQSAQTVGSSNSERVVPTVTLKRTEAQNGSGGSYVAQSSRQDKIRPSRRSKQLGFDPSAPISATPPEDLFDAEISDRPKDNLTSTKNIDVSSPETGEIVDDDDDGDDTSPFEQRVPNFSGYAQRSSFHKGSGVLSNFHHPDGYNNNNNVRQYDSHKPYDSRVPNLINTNVKRNEPR